LAKRLGVPQALGLSLEDWVTTRLGGYVKLSIADRREAVRNLTDEGHSTRDIGGILGVDHSTVVRDGANAPGSAHQPRDHKRPGDRDGANAPGGREAHELAERQENGTFLICNALAMFYPHGGDPRLWAERLWDDLNFEFWPDEAGRCHARGVGRMRQGGVGARAKNPQNEGSAMTLAEDPPRTRRPRLRFFYQDAVIVAERLRRRASDPSTGVVDESKWVTLVAEYADKHRDLFNADAFAHAAVALVKRRHNTVHRQRMKRGEIYVPMLLVPLPRRKLVPMKIMTVPLLRGWHEVEMKARRGAKEIVDAIELKTEFRMTNLAAMAENPDLKTLHEVQIHVFGYVPKPDDDKPDLTAGP
jgi:hypothetical protein